MYESTPAFSVSAVFLLYLSLLYDIFTAVRFILRGEATTGSASLPQQRRKSTISHFAAASSLDGQNKYK